MLKEENGYPSVLSHNTLIESGRSGPEHEFVERLKQRTKGKGVFCDPSATLLLHEQILKVFHSLFFSQDKVLCRT